MTERAKDPTTLAMNSAKCEFEALTVGRENLTISEVQELRHYAGVRAAMDSPESQLNSDQLAWRALFNSLDKELEDAVEPGQKARMDAAWQELEQWAREMRSVRRRYKNQTAESAPPRKLFRFCGTRIATGFSKVGRLLRSAALENAADWIYRKATGLGEPQTVIGFAAETELSCRIIDSFFDRQVEFFNEHQYEEKLKAAQARYADGGTQADRKRAAVDVLRLLDSSGKSALDHLVKVSRELGDLLYEFGEMASALPESDLRSKLCEWFESSKRLYLSRQGYSNYLRTRHELDRRMATDIVEHDGATDKITYQKEMLMAYGEAGIAGLVAKTKDTELQNCREKLRGQVTALMATKDELRLPTA